MDCRNLFVLCSLLAGFSFCLSAQPVYQHYIHTLTRADGLLQNWNWYAYRDSRGELWFSSVTGLNRFDGVSVQTYTPDERAPGGLQKLNICSDFFETTNGDVWFGAEEQLCRYRAATDQIESFDLPAGPFDSLKYWCHPFALGPRNQLWVLQQQGASGAPVGVIDLNGPRPAAFQAQFKLSRDADRCLAAADPQNGCIKYIAAFKWCTPGLSIVSPGPEGKPPFSIEEIQLPDHPAVYDLAFDGDSVLLAVTNRGIFRIKLPLASQRPLIRRIKACTDASCIVFDDRHRLWLGDFRGTITRIHPQSGLSLERIPVFPADAGKQKSTLITHLYADDNGNLWVVSQENGIAWIHTARTKFKSWNAFQGIVEKPALNALTLDRKGQLWVAIHNRLYAAWPGQVPRFEVESPHALPVVKMMADQRNRIWILNLNHIEVYDPDRGGLVRVAATKNQNYTQFLDFVLLADRRLLATSYQGLFEIAETSPGQFTCRPFMPELFSVEDGYTAIYKDQRNYLYIGKSLKEIWVLKPLPDGSYVPDGPPLPVIGDIYGWTEDDATVWAGTAYGLIRLNKRGGQWSKIGLKEGLPEQTVIALQVEGKKGLWLATYNHLIFFNPAQNHLQVFYGPDGVPQGGMDPKLSTGLPDGTALFSAGGRLMFAGTSSEQAAAVRPLPKITAILVDDMPDAGLTCASTGVTNPDGIRSIVLPFGRNTLSFSTIAVEYGNPSANYSEYCLEGLDTTWLRLPNPGFVRFPNLQAGTYRLRIRAFSAEGVSCPYERRIDILIQPPFYQTWWFYALVSLVLLALIRLYYQARLQQFKALQEVRQQIADDLHDDVGTAVTAIDVYSQTLKLMLGQDKPEVLWPLSRITENAQKTLVAFRDIIWSINPQFDKLSDLITRIRENVLAQRETHDITCSLDVQVQQENVLLHPKLRHNLYLIFKEALQNAVKYGAGAPITITIRSADNRLTLIVCDQGPGFDPDRVKPGQGLYTQQRRAHEIRGQLHIETRPGEGVCLTLHAPLY